MKTQINNLFSGTKNQILNANKDYNLMAPASSHGGHAGSDQEIVTSAWRKVFSENTESITIELWGEEITLTANWSKSGKSCHYSTTLTRDFLKKNTGIVAAKKEEPYLSIQLANFIIIGNGKNSRKNLCPSLITIK